jgi:hypothetical protein
MSKSFLDFRVGMCPDGQADAVPDIEYDDGQIDHVVTRVRRGFFCCSQQA